MPEFMQCEFCKAQIPSKTCELAAYNTVIDGKKYSFCCEQCARRYEERKKMK